MYLLELAATSEKYNELYCSKPLDENGWKKFVDDVNQQKYIPCGIYIRIMGTWKDKGPAWLHYYAVQRRDGVLTVANGYPTTSDIDEQYAVSLDVQPDQSHGLGYIYALMYCFGDEQLLLPGQHWNNVKVALDWLKKFAQNHPCHWTDHWFNTLITKDPVYLDEVIDFISDDQLLLSAWFKK